MCLNNLLFFPTDLIFFNNVKMIKHKIRNYDVTYNSIIIDHVYVIIIVKMNCV